MYLRTSKPYRKRPQNTRPMGLQKSPSRKFKNYQTTPILLKLNQQLSNLKNLKTKDLIITKVTSKVPRRSCIKTRSQFLNLVFNLLFPRIPSNCLHHVLSNPVSKPAYQLQENWRRERHVPIARNLYQSTALPSLFLMNYMSDISHPKEISNINTRIPIASNKSQR